ncbi:MAG: hypothetical protein JRI48_10750, partial [Deltaproteobacteria bacterium]|nr:hypothetical protein [Deltaproteobacteria bacterium]
ENPFSLSDDALKNLLKAFKNWFNENDEERKYSEDQRKIREDLKETFLNEEYILNKPDEELIQELFKYPQKLEGPVGIKLGIPRISDELSNIKSAITRNK